MHLCGYTIRLFIDFYIQYCINSYVEIFFDIIGWNTY